LEERIQKILSRCAGIARRKGEELIRQGLVTVNGKVAQIGDKADPEVDRIEVDGKPVKCRDTDRVYLLLNKPRGYLCTVSDPSHRPTVLDLVKTKTRVYPVGRLDMNSTGLVFLTNDGDIAHKIFHAGKHCPKVYLVKVAGVPDVKKINRLRKGIVVGGERFAPCQIEEMRSKPGSYTWFKVTLYQGRNRQIRRMFDAIQFRGFKQKTVETLAAYSGVPVYNGLTDDFHPTQVLADLMTVKENFDTFKGVKMVFAGDGRNNMANSLMIGCAKMGVNYTIAAPKTLWPDQRLVEECSQWAQAAGSEIKVTDSLEEAVKGAHVIYTDVWASMGEETKAEERRKMLLPYQITEDVMRSTDLRETIFMHCLPAVKGQEVVPEVIDGPQSRVWDEAENRKHTIKAIMLVTI